MTKIVRRVRRYQIQKGSSSYDELKELCLKSRNMYNSTLFILRQLYFASFPKNHESDYYLSRIPEDIRKYVESESKEYVNKDTKEKKSITFYNIVVHSSVGEGKVSDEKALYAVFLRTNNVDYKAIMATASRSSVKLAYKAMKSFKARLKNKSKYTGEPKLPRFKKDDELVPFSIDNFKTDKNDKSITINGTCKLKNVYISEEMSKVKQIRVVPHMSMNVFEVEIVYEKYINVCEPYDGWMGIDLGINNICAITTDKGEGLLINGKALKNINHFYNKNMSELKSLYCENGNSISKSVKDNKTGITNIVKIAKGGKKSRMMERKRENKINTFMHQTSRAVIDFAVSNKIGHIVVGHNNGWKQECNLGRKTNQNFIQIPFNKLIMQLKYKGEEYGIEVIEKEEGYTSKCSALDKEDIVKHETYMGKRGGRHNKEFITGNRKLVNADINGSLNILRLGIKDIGVDIGEQKKSILTPPKFNKIGREKMQSQNLLNFSEDMVEKSLETDNSLKIQATVDSHNMEKSTFKEYIHSLM